MAPFVRIGLRWLGGMLVAKGWLGAGDQGLLADPELVSAICYGLAALCGLAAEGWYVLARKFGWSK